MNTLILHTKASTCSPAEILISLGGISTGLDETTLSAGKAWIRLTQADDVIEDYDAKYVDFLKSLGPERRSYMVEWRGDDFLQEFLKSIPENRDFIIDNDHGVIIHFDLIREKPIADWIREGKILEITV